MDGLNGDGFDVGRGEAVKEIDTNTTIPTPEPDDQQRCLIVIEKLQGDLLDALRQNVRVQKELIAAKKKIEQLTQKLKTTSSKKCNKCLHGKEEQKKKDSVDVGVQTNLIPVENNCTDLMSPPQNNDDAEDCAMGSTDASSDETLLNKSDDSCQEVGPKIGIVTSKNKGDTQKKIRPKCPFCCKAYRNSDRLREHIFEHTGEKGFKCTMCDKAFRRKEYLEQHTRVHTGEKPFTCSECGKSFSSYNSLYLHLRTHTNKKTFQCSICSKAFLQSGHLSVHMKSHSELTPFKCLMCSKSYKSKASLIEHHRSHTGEKPFQCSKCGQVYAYKNQLTRHLKSHADLRSYQCSICSKAFNDKSILNRHMGTHSGERPHRCPICDRAFRLNYNLTQHIKTHNKTGSSFQQLPVL